MEIIDVDYQTENVIRSAADYSGSLVNRGTYQPGVRLGGEQFRRDTRSRLVALISAILLLTGVCLANCDVEDSATATVSVDEYK